MLSENKFSKYLLYAIGEIILVVIGILIALNINNANEQQKKEKEINAILKQIQNELVSNIDRAELIMRNYRKKDSLLYLIMINDVTYDDYKQHKIPGLRAVVASYQTLIVQNNGYLDLINYAKYAPKKLDSILFNLKSLYVNKLAFLEGTNESIMKLVYEYQEWRRLNTSWASNYYFSKKKIDDDEINFYLNSNYYKNLVQNYFNIGIQNHYYEIARFRQSALNNYKAITSYLGQKEKTTTKPNSFLKDESLYKNYEGTYRSKNHTIIINSSKEELLVRFVNLKKEYSIIPVNTNAFIPMSGGFWYVRYDADGDVIGLEDRQGDEIIDYKKID